MKTIKPLLSLPVILLMVFILSCNNDKKNLSLITERIQYDVFINTIDSNNLGWWVQNIEGVKREKFVKSILDIAASGKVKAYDYNNDPLTVNDVKSILCEIDSVQLQRPYPPYEEYDTILKNEVMVNDVVKVRFMEEWYMDDKNLQINKKVAGIAPMVKSFAPDGTFRGYRFLFWLYFDKDYPAKIKTD